MSDIRLPIRQLVEFLLRSGSIDSRFAGFDRALEGARIHRRLQKAAGEGYAAEVPLCADYTVDGIRFTLEGRADGIFTDEEGLVTIEEIKTVCWCGRKATFNARVQNGHIVREGEQIMMGGNSAYVSLCRRHWKDGNLGSFCNLNLED